MVWLWLTPLTRSTTRKFIALVSTLALLLTLYTFSTSSTSSKLPPFPLPYSAPQTCLPRDYADGSWKLHPRVVEGRKMQSKDDVLEFSGLMGCASSREYYWHLASDTESQWNRFPAVNSWEWIPGWKCEGLRRLDPRGMVKHLVEQGGWLLVGDSVTENHFFSLSCLLYPHVLATPDYSSSPYFDRAWPQNLYLNPSSSLVNDISFPEGFNISSTPLATFLRIDLLFSQTDLMEAHRTLYPDDYTNGKNFTLFSDESVWTLPLTEYLELFTTSSSTGNYATMIVSTGGHWTTTLFSGYRDESQAKDGYGINGIIQFFEQVMERWVVQVQAHVSRAEKKEWLNIKNVYGVGGDLHSSGRKRRNVVIRAYLPGHEDCHESRAAWQEVKPFVFNWFNWGSIWRFNEVFENLLSDRKKYPNIHYLPIDKPARLRPDAHATGDCLHIMTGAGVLEGWSHYIWHYITKELR